MSERWRTELGKLDELEPPMRLLDDARSLPAPAPGGPTRRSRVVAGVVAIAVFLVAGAFALRAFDDRQQVSGSRPTPAASCPKTLPTGAIAVVTCEQGVEQAWSVAAFISTADNAEVSWREYPGSFEGRTIPSWLVTFGGARYLAGNDGCVASGSLATYTVVVSASSGGLVASDGPPEGCPVAQQIAPLVELPSDPCALVTTDQIAAATSSNVLSSRQLTDSDLKVPGPPYPCDFQTDGRFGHVGVVSVPSDPQGFTDRLNKDPANRKIVSGIGDGAFISGGAAIVVSLGDGYFQIVMQHGAGAEAEPPLRRLANDTLGNLAAVQATAHTGDVAGSEYTDPTNGWSVTAPPSLTLQSFGVPNLAERGDVSGVSVANFSTDAVPSGDGLKPLQQFPSTGVLFMMWENAPGQMGVNTSDDTHLPLSLSDYRRIPPYVGGDEPTPLYRPLVEGGGTFVSVVWIGPEASDADRRAIEQTVASIAFPDLEPFTISPTSTAVVLEAASSYPVGSVTAITPEMLRAAGPSVSNFGAPLTESGFYVVHGTDGFYGVPMNAQAPQTQDTCHVSADTKNITFSCVNGATWDRYVQAVTPPANNDEMHGYWLFVIPITVSWDGHLLANAGNDPQVATDAWGADHSPSG